MCARMAVSMSAVVAGLAAGCSLVGCSFLGCSWVETIGASHKHAPTITAAISFCRCILPPSPRSATTLTEKLLQFCRFHRALRADGDDEGVATRVLELV